MCYEINLIHFQNTNLGFLHEWLEGVHITPVVLISHFENSGFTPFWMEHGYARENVPYIELYKTAGLSLPPMASISSKKIRQAFLVLAISNSSLTILAPYRMDVYIHQDSESKQLLFFVRCVSQTLATLTSPTYFCTSSEPMTLMKQASVLLATARAHRVFPVPGGPNSSTPLGGSIPRLTNLSGWWAEDKDRKMIRMVTWKGRAFWSISVHLNLGECCDQEKLWQWFRFGIFSWFVNTHMEQGGLDHFSQLLDLLLTPTNIAVGHIRLLLHLKTRDKLHGCTKAVD